MARSFSTGPENANLSETIEHRINFYCLAVAAAGVSTLAMGQPADATVVITNTNIPIPNCAFAFPCSVSLDLNGDGVNDLKFSLINTYSYSTQSNHLNVSPLNGGGVIGIAGGAHGPYASALLRGAKIGASDHFSGGKDRIEVSYRGYDRSGILSALNLYGKWGGNHPNRFIGVKFKINGKTHFGWVRITVTTPSPSCVPLCDTFMSGTITEYGYETVANKSLGAGLAGAAAAVAPNAQENKTQQSHPSLGMLALGSDGLPLWRREEELVH